MGVQRRGARWVVVSWQDDDGNWVSINCDATQVYMEMDFSPVDTGTIASIMVPRNPPLLQFHFQAPMRECQKRNTHQQCVDTTQRYLQERRPP